MKIKIDTQSTKFLVGGHPRPQMDFETGQQKIDPKTLKPAFQVPLILLDEEGAQVLDVKVSGDPGPLAPGQAVDVEGLTGTTWSVGERNGVSFRAVTIKSVAPPRVQKSVE